MGSVLNDRLANDYSNRYVLVIPPRYYLPYSGINNIAVLASPGLGEELNEFIDPVRQCLGKFWTLTDAPLFVDVKLAEFFQETTGVRFFWPGITGPTSYSNVLENITFEDIDAAKFYEGTDDLSAAGDANTGATKSETQASPPPPPGQTYAAGYKNFLKILPKYQRIKLFLAKSNPYEVARSFLSLITPIASKTFGYDFVVGYEDGPDPDFVGPPTPGQSGTTIKQITKKMPSYSVATQPYKYDGQLPSNVSVPNMPTANEILDSAVPQAFLKFFPNQQSSDGIGTYEDMAFSLPLPMTPLALSLRNDVNKNDLYADIVPTYNFYSKLYEKFPQNYKTIGNAGPAISERQLPLIYEVPLEADTTAASVVGTKFEFEKFAKQAGACNGTPDNRANNQNVNVYLDQENQAFLDQFETIKTQFPFHIDFKIKTDTNRQFTDAFIKAGLMKPLIDTWISNMFTYDWIYRGDDVSKDHNITKLQDEPDAPMGNLPDNKYYDPLDNKYANKDAAAQICFFGIYEINQTLDFYEVKPPLESKTKNLDESFVKAGGADQTRIFNLDHWVNHYVRSLDQEMLQFGDVFKNEVIRPKDARDNTNYFGTSTTVIDETSDIEALIGVVKLANDFKSLTEKECRSYSDIMEGKLAYSEVMFYRIAKLDADTGNVIQNFWLPKPSTKAEDKSIVEYVDSQVRYDKEYMYKVYAYTVVVSTEYGYKYSWAKSSYSSVIAANLENDPAGLLNSAVSEGYFLSSDETDPDLDLFSISKTLAANTPVKQNRYNKMFHRDGDQNKASLAFLDMQYRPRVKLIEVPIFTKKVTIADAPPIAPEVDIVPLVGKKNNLLFNLYPQTGDIEMEPLPITAEEFYKYIAIRKSQERDLLKPNPKGFPFPMNSDFIQPKLRFKSDDVPKTFKVYRVDNKPSSYIEFADNEYVNLEFLKGQSGFEETIEVNKKYYYMFRTVDIHDNISNPSDIYEVEMVNNSGVTYPVIKIVDLEMPTQGNKTKTFRRFLKIEASKLQSLFSKERTGITSEGTLLDGKDPVLGVADKPLFNHRKLKFRIRSKHTGKIIDLNVSFKTRHNKITEEVVGCESGEVGGSGGAETYTKETFTPSAPTSQDKKEEAKKQAINKGFGVF